MDDVVNSLRVLDQNWQKKFKIQCHRKIGMKIELKEIPT